MIKLTPEKPPYYEIVDQKIRQYAAIITQTGTNAPVATLLINTIKTATWTRAGLGVYNLEFGAGNLPGNIYIPGFTDWDGIGTTVGSIYQQPNIVGYYTLYYNQAAGIITLETNATAGTDTDLGTLIGTSKFHVPTIYLFN